MRLMQSWPFYGCVMVLRERVFVMHAIRATRVQTREVEGCRAAILVPLRPRNHRVITGSHGVRRKGCRGVK